MLTPTLETEKLIAGLMHAKRVQLRLGELSLYAKERNIDLGSSGIPDFDPASYAIAEAVIVGLEGRSLADKPIEAGEYAEFIRKVDKWADQFGKSGEECLSHLSELLLIVEDFQEGEYE